MIDWRRGDYERALERVAVSIDRLPPQAPLFNNLGLCLASLWRYEDAADAYRRALAQDERYAEAHNNLGLCLRELDRRAEAAESFRRALALHPHFEQARWNLELCLREDRR
jgi:tetratricopeptide (TPR) repeat protein